MRISDWSSDVCSSDLCPGRPRAAAPPRAKQTRSLPCAARPLDKELRSSASYARSESSSLSVEIRPGAPLRRYPYVSGARSHSVRPQLFQIGFAELAQLLYHFAVTMPDVRARPTDLSGGLGKRSEKA